MALSRSLRSAFELELSRSDVNSICLTDVLIDAIVSEGMAMRSGVSASFVSSLAKANLNIRVIAKGLVRAAGRGRREGPRTCRGALRSGAQWSSSRSPRRWRASAILGGRPARPGGQALVRRARRTEGELREECEFWRGRRRHRVVHEDESERTSSASWVTPDVDQLLGGDDSRDLDMDAFTASLESDVNSVID